MTLHDLVQRVMGKHLPPEQPTGRVCVGCHNVIRRNDKWHLLAAKHDDCNFPQGSPLPPSLERLIEEGN